jgi:hypothetical protein
MRISNPALCPTLFDILLWGARLITQELSDFD